MEYLILIGFTLSVISILTIMYYENTEDTNYEIANSQLGRIGKKIIDTAEEVYYLGKPTKTTLKLYMPANVEEIVVQGRELVFRVNHKGKTSDLVHMSSINITGNLTSEQGIQYVEIIADDGFVRIES